MAWKRSKLKVCLNASEPSTWKGTHLLILERVQPGIQFLLLDAQVVHLVQLPGVFLRLHHQLPPHLSNLFLPGKEGGAWTM